MVQQDFKQLKLNVKSPRTTLNGEGELMCELTSLHTDIQPEGEEEDVN